MAFPEHQTLVPFFGLVFSPRGPVECNYRATAQQQPSLQSRSRPASVAAVLLGHFPAGMRRLIRFFIFHIILTPPASHTHPRRSTKTHCHMARIKIRCIVSVHRKMMYLRHVCQSKTQISLDICRNWSVFFVRI